MGRTVTYESAVQEKINEIFKQKNIHSGLIIGQCTEQKDIVIRLCPTPSNEDVDNENDDEESRMKKSKSSTEFNLDQQWICQHSKQLLRTLPGGLNILGLYIVAESDYSTKYQVQLKQVMFAIYNMIAGSTKNQLNLCSKERVLLNICPKTCKITCRTYNISDNKCSATPADFKLQSTPTRWHRLRCQLAVDTKFPLKSESTGYSFLEQMETAWGPFLENVNIAYALVGGKQRHSDELLDSTQQKSKKKHSEKEFSTDWHDVEIFLPLESNSVSKVDVFDCACMMTFKGTVHCRAYVHSKATVGEAVSALKEDIMRSIVARCEIHCEDLLLIEEEQKDPLVVHELPRRVFAPLPESDVCVCDYQFHSDRPSDSLEAFMELLDLELNEEEIDTSWETSPTTSALILPEAMEDRLSEFGDTPTHKVRENVLTNPLIPIVGLTATIAVGIASFILMFYNS